MGEMENLTLAGGKRHGSAPKRSGPLGSLDRRQGLRNTIRRSSRRLSGAISRIRGKRNIDEEQDESLKNSNGDSGDFHDHEDNPREETNHNDQDSRPVNELDSDDNDDFLDPQEYIDYTPNGDGMNKEILPSSHSKVHEVSDHDSDFDQDDDDGLANDANDGQYGQYDDEYENNSAARSKDSKNNDGGYKDGENRQDQGSPRNNGGRRSSLNRRNGLLKQLSKKLSGSRRNIRKTKSRDLSNESSGSNPTSSPTSPAEGRIEGFGSTAPEFTSPRTLRQKLKDFRENRIAARKQRDEMMQHMDVGDDPKKKNLKERLDNVVDAMVDASIPQAELGGYMSAASLMETPNTKSSTATPANTLTPADASKMSYLRKQFGDDNAYIIYLEGEQVAHELEVISHRNRIEELEAEARRLKALVGEEDGVYGGDGNKSNVASKIEGQTGVPEEGVLIDLEGTNTIADQEQSVKLPLQLPLMKETGGTEPQSNTTSTLQSTEPLPTPVTEQLQDMPNQKDGTNKTEQNEGDLADLSARDQARDIVDSILADVLNERKVTNQEDQKDTSSSPADALPVPPADAPPESTAHAPPATPVDAPPALIDPSAETVISKETLDTQSTTTVKTEVINPVETKPTEITQNSSSTEVAAVSTAEQPQAEVSHSTAVTLGTENVLSEDYLRLPESSAEA